MATTTAWIRSGAGIISNVPSTPFVRESKTITSTVTKYTAVALVSSYDQGNISVWANGTLLLEGTQQDENDFWAPGGLNLYFNADLLTDDVIHVQHYTTHALSDSSFIQRTATQGNTPTRAFIFSEMNDVKPVLAFYNGILISDGNDYTRTGSNFTLDNNLNVNSGDVLTLYIHGAYNVADHFSKGQWGDGSITQTVDLRNATVYPDITAQQPFIKATEITKTIDHIATNVYIGTTLWNANTMIAGTFTLGTEKPILFINMKITMYQSDECTVRLATATDSGFTQDYQAYTRYVFYETNCTSKFQRIYINCYEDNYAWATAGSTIYTRCEVNGRSGGTIYAHYNHHNIASSINQDYIMIEEFKRAT